MRRTARTLVLALALAAGALAGSAPAVAAPEVSVDVTDCRTAINALDRSVSFRGEMEAVPRTDRMAMRFELYVQEPADEDFVRVDGPGLGEWIRSASGVGKFIWTKQLTNLDVPAEYRARISFRWYDRSGDVIERAVRRTQVCRQADERPNLTLGRPAVEAGPQPDLVRYALPVRNTGKGDAPPFDVTLDGKMPTTVSGLKVGDTQTVRFIAPRCSPGQALLFAADGDGLVEETDESDNALRVECPVVARRR
ncbi:MAG TPA: CARDB domain-containing protein [Capillimicrobium sp.]|nr:CARDB domain-containing protein [Capillimicrobium sp.]